MLTEISHRRLIHTLLTDVDMRICDFSALLRDLYLTLQQSTILFSHSLSEFFLTDGKIGVLDFGGVELDVFPRQY